MRKNMMLTGEIPAWSFADRVRKARLHAGMSQRELADATMLSLSTISNYETGLTAPLSQKKRRVARAIGAATGVDHGWILGENLTSM